MKFSAEISHGRRLIPLYNSDDEKLSKLRPGTEYIWEVKKPRNVQFHRKAFALLNLGFQNQDRYEDVELYREDITITSGFYTMIPSTKFGEVPKAKSWSFAAMDDFEFGELYKALFDTVAHQLYGDALTEQDKEIMRRELESFL